ncbi:hypothetical protein [Oceanisphaera ostreae]|uniref:Uncharacterized protein n=1 Tax=Oceanisphaera ostreae TaxID=914151 RepID=A0ABW3KMB0_9GAMM
MNKHWLWVAIFVPGMLLADEIEDTHAEIKQAITAGTEAYQAGELSQAVTQFDYVSTLVRQLQAGELGNLFPEPLSGWKADEVESQAGSTAFFGGGINASRSYRKDGGQLEISITKDSPLLQTMGMLFTNPSMATMGGYKVKRIKGQTAMIKSEGNSQELQMMVANSILIQITGRGINENDLKAYAEALDIEAITKL